MAPCSILTTSRRCNHAVIYSLFNCLHRLAPAPSYYGDMSAYLIDSGSDIPAEDAHVYWYNVQETSQSLDWSRGTGYQLNADMSKHSLKDSSNSMSFSSFNAQCFWDDLVNSCHITWLNGLIDWLIHSLIGRQAIYRWDYAVIHTQSKIYW